MASLITAAFGIGGGVMLIGVLATLLPPVALIPVHGLVQFGSNLGRAGLLIRHIEWRNFPGFFAGTLVGAIAGGLISVNLPAHLIQMGIGGFILFSVFSRFPDMGRGTVWIVGLVASFLSMFFGATGPFISSYVRGLGLGRMEHVATHAAFMTLQHILKVFVFGLFGFAFGPYMLLIVAMIASGFVGTILGRQFLIHIDDGKFRLVLNIMLSLIAARLIWIGASSALGI